VNAGGGKFPVRIKKTVLPISAPSNPKIRRYDLRHVSYSVLADLCAKRQGKQYAPGEQTLRHMRMCINPAVLYSKRVLQID
jgi:hypothetical protein